VTEDIFGITFIRENLNFGKTIAGFEISDNPRWSYLINYSGSSLTICQKYGYYNCRLCLQYPNSGQLGCVELHSQYYDASSKKPEDAIIKLHDIVMANKNSYMSEKEKVYKLFSTLKDNIDIKDILE
jgi:hypothetical protein